MKLVLSLAVLVLCGSSAEGADLCIEALIERARTPACVEVTRVRAQGVQGARLMVVLRTNGCYFDKGESGCTMCNFKEHSIRPQDYRVTADDLEIQLRRALKEKQSQWGDVVQLDLLTLGNFLNRGEVPEPFWRSSMEIVSELPSLKRVVIESRTPFINRENIEVVRSSLRPDISLEVSVGVESTDDRIRNGIIKKDLSRADLVEAMETVGKLSDQNVTFQVYLLIKPQTLSEREAIEDAVRSAATIASLAREKQVVTRIAFEPVFVTRNTPLEQEYLAGRYVPVNLWSVIEVIQRTHSHREVQGNPFVNGIFIGLSDEGLSEGREARSCSNCQQRLRKGIEEYNGTQDLSVFSDLSCSCKPTLSQWTRPLSFQILPEELAVYKLSAAGLPRPPALESEFWWASGNTLVCRPGAVPVGVEIIDSSIGWRALKMSGEWKHSETGVIAPVFASLALAHIPIMFVSDWETDYILVHSSNLDKAVGSLNASGHRVISPQGHRP